MYLQILLSTDNTPNFYEFGDIVKSDIPNEDIMPRSVSIPSYLNDRMVLSLQSSRFELPMDMKSLESKCIKNGCILNECCLLDCLTPYVPTCLPDTLRAYLTDNYLLVYLTTASLFAGLCICLHFYLPPCKPLARMHVYLLSYLPAYWLCAVVSKN